MKEFKSDSSRKGSPLKKSKLTDSSPKCKPPKTNIERDLEPLISGFCCKFHDMEFATDFDSEDDIPYVKPTKPSTGKDLVFMKEIPLAIQHDLALGHRKREASTQCQSTDLCTLYQLSLKPVIIPSSSECRRIEPRTRLINLHLPMWTQEKIETSQSTMKADKVLEVNTESLQCCVCERKFTSGQALGGHMSRRHSRKFVRHKRKRSESEDEVYSDSD